MVGGIDHDVVPGRAGANCLRVELFKSGRCRNHGGMSSGPKTPQKIRQKVKRDRPMGVLALRSPAGIFSVHFGFLHAVGAAAVPRSWHARGH